MISNIAENESFNDGCILNVRSMKKYRKRETTDNQQRRQQKYQQIISQIYSSSEHCFYQLERSK